MIRCVASLMLVASLCSAGQLTPQQHKLMAELRVCPFTILFESYRNGNWELLRMNADGSHVVSLTQTPDIDEMYPHASPDGTKVLFVADQRKGGKRTHDIYYMNIDGTGRVKVGKDGRQPFWGPEGKRIGYMRAHKSSFSEAGRGNRGLYYHNIETGKETQHPRRDVYNVLNPCWSSNGKWIVATILGGMGFRDSIVIFEAHGTKVFELARTHAEGKNVYQCRPDISPNGRHVAWGKDDVDARLQPHRRTMWIEVGDVDLNAPEIKLANRRYAVTVKYPKETYHVDWSPDSRYIAYSQGDRGTGRMAGSRPVVGRKAPGWDIWVVKPTEPEVAVQLTFDGQSNKEPDWVAVAPRTGKSGQ